MGGMELGADGGSKAADGDEGGGVGGGGGRGVWGRAAAWIEERGGFVHPKLRYDQLRRRVYVGGNGGNKDGGIDEGATLLVVPDRCLVTLRSVEEDGGEFGTSLFRAVRSLADGGDGNGDGKGNGSGNSGSGSICSDGRSNGNGSDNDHQNNGGDGSSVGGLHHDPKDAILALYLARLLHRSDARREHFHAPYLATLPRHSRHLPRQWSPEDLDRRLRGTSLHRRVVEERAELKREHDSMRSSWRRARSGRRAEGDGSVCEDEADIKCEFPPFERYDEAMALLTSRGFAGLGPDGSDAMIPLLDLLDHVRGRGGDDGDDNGGDGGGGNGGNNGDDNSGNDGGSNGNSSKRGANKKRRRGPDVRYERFERDDEVEGPARKRQKVEIEERLGTESVAKSGAVSRKKSDEESGEGREARSGVRVRAARDLPPGSELRMTYGAKSNVALLGRYGFCVDDNVEPDGSCNDVLELVIAKGEPPAELRRGPKAYSYGPFAKALRLCRDALDEGDEGEGRRDDDEGPSATKGCTKESIASDDGPEGLEAFLDSCDAELDGDGDDVGGEDFEDDEEGEGDDDDWNARLYDAPDDLPDPIRSDASSRRASTRSDLRAVGALEEVLRDARALRAENSLAALADRGSGGDADEGTDDVAVEDVYCAILLRSEVRTLDFYLRATAELGRRLADYPDEVRDGGSSLAPGESRKEEGNGGDRFVDDGEGAWDEAEDAQIRGLVDAFLTIHHPASCCERLKDV